MVAKTLVEREAAINNSKKLTPEQKAEKLKLLHDAEKLRNERKAEAAKKHALAEAKRETTWNNRMATQQRIAGKIQIRIDKKKAQIKKVIDRLMVLRGN